MPENPALEELREGLEEFVPLPAEQKTGDEKGEAQVFLDRFIHGSGHGGVRGAGAARADSLAGGRGALRRVPAMTCPTARPLEPAA